MLATTLLVEGGPRAMIVTLDKPMTLVEIWELFVNCKHRPMAITLSAGMARVIL